MSSQIHQDKSEVSGTRRPAAESVSQLVVGNGISMMPPGVDVGASVLHQSAMTPQHDGNQKHPSSLQLKTILGPPVQLALDSSGTYTTGATLPVVTPNTASVTGTKSLSGSPTSASIYVTSISSTSPPADPKDFTKWRDYNSLNLLHEHSRSYNLTRMHAIRGKFHGPGQQDNMFLGTMASNNSHSNSHLNEVERPIENFINSTSGQRGVLYSVTPNYSSAPNYITARASGISNSTDKSDFQAWAPEACPATFTCNATFYKANSSSTTGYESKSDSATISTAL